MVNLSELLSKDPTLALADSLLEQLENSNPPRPYLGMSAIGESCSRKLWYRFRFALKETFDAITHKRFIDGHRTEALVIERLKLVPGLEVIDQVDGKQIGFTQCNGHHKGNMDGKITGLLQAPKTPHVLEVKATGEKKFNELNKIISKVGEKLALREWNQVYYGQAQSYMRETGFTRHYTVIATAGGRDWVGIRTEVDVAHGAHMLAKADRIIKAQNPPERIGDETYFECRYCAFSSVCHQNDMPDRNCRTCLHSTPVEDGQWLCERFGKKLTFDEQLIGCGAHKFIPEMVPGEIIDSNEKGITYKMHNSIEWWDGEI